MRKTLLYFLVGTVAGWSLLMGLACVRWERDGLHWNQDRFICVASTGAICIVPTSLSLLWSLWSARRSGSEQLLAMMGGMGLRMFVALGLALVVFLGWRSWFQEVKEREYAFWGSLLVTYLLTLGWETFLLARRNDNQRGKV